MNGGGGIGFAANGCEQQGSEHDPACYPKQNKGKNRVSGANDNWLFNKRRRSRSVKAVGCWLLVGRVGKTPSAKQTQHRSKQLKQAHEQDNWLNWSELLLCLRCEQKLQANEAGNLLCRNILLWYLIADFCCCNCWVLTYKHPYFFCSTPCSGTEGIRRVTNSVPIYT